MISSKPSIFPALFTSPLPELCRQILTPTTLPACAQELDLAPHAPSCRQSTHSTNKTASKTGMSFTLQIKCCFYCTRSEIQFSLLSHPGKGWLYSQVSSWEELCSLEMKTTVQADQAAAAAAALLWHFVSDNAMGGNPRFFKGRIFFHRKW